jgi:DNA-binding NarL/FixJ family response regulator
MGNAPVMKARVLIVDDHPVVRAGLAHLVGQQADLAVAGEAEDVPGALRKISQLKPQLILTDLNLGADDGLEMIKQACAREPSLPILVVSMHDENLYAERVLRAGAKGYVMKRAGASQLMEAIRAVLRGETYVSPAYSRKVVGRLSGRAGETSELERLSDRELQVFRLIGKGWGTRKIAEYLTLSVKTVETHCCHIKRKLNLDDVNALLQHAVAWCQRESA